MLTRLVKMHFHPEETANFIMLFEQVKDRIRAFEGCEEVKLIQDIDTPGIFFTLSKWQSEQDLENYRKSELFADTWAKTKRMFATKAMAWSTEEVVSGQSSVVSRQEIQ